MFDSLSPDQIEDLIRSRNIAPEMAISLAQDAASKAQELALSNPEYNNLPLRVYIEGKGCDGFYYGVAFDSKDTNDFAFESHGVQIVIDPDSLKFMLGSIILWVNDERGEGFIVENPCHYRFRGKFYKKKAWTSVLSKSVNSTSSQ